MSVDLSIIVPVYNVKTYLQRCIGSLLDQDLIPRDYEIILVDDGSTDGSGCICDDYARRYDNIRVFHQGNAGLSSARNRGIQEALGEYIQFVDSDDYLTGNVLGSLLRQAQEQRLDVLRFNYQNVDQEGNPFQLDKTPKLFADYSSDVCDGITFLNDRLGYACYAVQFLIHTALLKPEDRWFKPGIYYEDAQWAPRMLLYSERIASTDLIAYQYVYRSNSITKDTSLEKRRKALDDRMSLIDGYLLMAKRVSDNRWFMGMIANVVIGILNDVSRFFFKERSLYIGTLEAKGIFPLTQYHATATARKKIALINLSRKLACRVLHHKRVR